MPKYVVDIPIAGYVSLEIEADSKEEAIDKAFAQGFEDEDIMELEMYEHITEGNVCSAPLNDLHIEEGSLYSED